MVIADKKSTPHAQNNSKEQTLSKSNDQSFDRDTLIIRCLTMRYTEKEALAYLKSKGNGIKRDQYYKDKARLQDSVIHKAYKFAAENGLIEQHWKRIDTLETAEAEHWQNYRKEKQPFKKSCILEKITALQPFIASAYDYVKEIIKTQAEIQQKIADASKPKIEVKA